MPILSDREPPRRRAAWAWLAALLLLVLFGGAAAGLHAQGWTAELRPELKVRWGEEYLVYGPTTAYRMLRIRGRPTPSLPTGAQWIPDAGPWRCLRIWQVG